MFILKFYTDYLIAKLISTICCSVQAVKTNPHDYDAWFDYLRLMESDGDTDQTREVYERAIANVPPSKVGETLHKLYYTAVQLGWKDHKSEVC